MLGSIPLGLPNLAALSNGGQPTITVGLLTDVDTIYSIQLGSAFLQQGFFVDEDIILAPRFRLGPPPRVESRGPYGDYGRRIGMSFYKQRITIGQP